MAKRGPRAHRTPYEQLLEEIRVTNVLLAASLREHLRQMEIVRLLSELTSLTASDIASILGTSTATVAVTMGWLRERQRSEPRSGRYKENSNV